MIVLTAGLVNKKFNFAIPLKKDSTSNGTLVLIGTASTTDKDTMGDKIADEAIVSMKEQLENGLTLFDSHEYTLDTVYGKIYNREGPDDELSVYFEILESKRAKIEELLDNGIELGLSIGGMVLDSEYSDDTYTIKEIKLIEISLTPLPANLDTLGTVTRKKSLCKRNICSQIFKSMNLEDEDMIDENKIREIVGDMLTKQAEPDPSEGEGDGEDDVMALLHQILELLQEKEGDEGDDTTKSKDKDEDDDPTDDSSDSEDDDDDKKEKNISRDDMQKMIETTLKKMGIAKAKAPVKTDSKDETLKSIIEELIIKRSHTKPNMKSVDKNVKPKPIKIKSLDEQGRIMAKSGEKRGFGVNPTIAAINKSIEYVDD